MDKRKVIDEIRNYLNGELAEARGAGDGPRETETERLLLMYRFLPVRDFSAEDVVVPSALVELALENTRAYYFVVPQGGGLVTRVDGMAVQVITPQSPLGEALLGKKAGDEVVVATRGGSRRYKVVSIK